MGLVPRVALRSTRGYFHFLPTGERRGCINQVSDGIILLDWEEKRRLGNPRYSRPGGRRYVSDGYIFMLSKT
jgi:hypothetical protein